LGIVTTSSETLFTQPAEDARSHVDAYHAAVARELAG
jgi:hypothetical protein